MPKPRDPSKKRATIYDLANHAGVSPGTVSRVLNNRDRVDPETRARILTAAKELGLKPRAGARLQQIAIVSEPKFADRIEGYAARLTSHLSFGLSRRNAAVVHPADPVTYLPGSFLDGVIAVTCDQPEFINILGALEKRLPVVYMDKFDAKPDQYVVCSDHFQAGYLAGQHFIARGKKRLAIVGEDFLPMRERLRGFCKAINEAGLKPEERLLQLFERHTGTTLQMSMITQKVRAGADAMYAPGTSYEGLNCLHVLSYVLGLQIPRDISLITSDVPGISEVSTPPLTTIEEPLAEMASRASEMVIRAANGEKVTRHLTLPVRLIERASVF